MIAQMFRLNFSQASSWDWMMIILFTLAMIFIYYMAFRFYKVHSPKVNKIRLILALGILLLVVLVVWIFMVVIFTSQPLLQLTIFQVSTGAWMMIILYTIALLLIYYGAFFIYKTYSPKMNKILLILPLGILCLAALGIWIFVVGLLTSQP
ncbi:MAG: hypothetical protein ABSB41_09765 [Anaerolineales bacterium]|jgi:hypothetical protein